jgi:hypothetical protein
MNATKADSGLAHLLERRCFLLFLSLLTLLLTMGFLGGTTHGRAAIGLLNAVVLLTAVASVGRTRLAIVTALLIAVPTFGFQIMALQSESPAHLVLSLGCAAVFYAYTIVHLLHYVLRRDRMTADKLYGAVAVYVMVAILWAFVFGVLQYFYPGAYGYQGTPKNLDLGELMFYSFTVLTTAGFGDITPMLLQSRFMTIVEAVSGVMYVAILIARLTGVYPDMVQKS